MLVSETSPTETESPEYYLQPGEQTKWTPEIESKIPKLEGDMREKVETLLKYTRHLPREAPSEAKADVFRKRTGVAIIEDNFATGCTDRALAFITVARHAEIPTSYVETLDEAWLKGLDQKVAGHVYVKVYDYERGNWRWVDPTRGTLDISLPKTAVVFKEGLDSWDLGLTDMKTTIKELNSFRDEWQEKH